MNGRTVWNDLVDEPPLWNLLGPDEECRGLRAGLWIDRSYELILERGRLVQYFLGVMAASHPRMAAQADPGTNTWDSLKAKIGATVVFGLGGPGKMYALRGPHHRLNITPGHYFEVCSLIYEAGVSVEAPFRAVSGLSGVLMSPAVVRDVVRRIDQELVREEAGL